MRICGKPLFLISSASSHCRDSCFSILMNNADSTSGDLDDVELGDFSGYKLYPLSEEKRSTVRLVRKRSARAVHFQDELGGSLDQTFYSNNLDYEVQKKSCCTIV